MSTGVLNASLHSVSCCFQRLARAGDRAYRLLVALCLLSFPAWALTAPADLAHPLAPGDYALSLTHQGQVRDYLLHVPPMARKQTPLPLLLVLHGGMGNMQIQANERFYHQISAADEYGYVVVFPNGYSRQPGGKFATWNAGSCCGPAVKAHSDDVGFIRAVIDDVQHKLAINPQQVFADGMSNGGMMAYRLACELSDKLSAVASVAGPDQTLQCQPSRPVSVLHIHAKDDDHVPYGGGQGPRALAGIQFHAVEDSIQQWRQRNQATGAAETVLSVPGAQCLLYRGPQADVQHCVTDSGGHAWPGGSKPRGGQSGSSALSANAVIWQFFLDHARRPSPR